jgi:hypothetical protein
VLMRAAGVPARVVTGYLGGEWNPSGGYLVVRQADAHAWAEVWLEGRGWTRVDPTAVVEPERLQRGAFYLLSESMPASTRLLRAAPWLVHMLQRWDAANAWWNDRVVRFDYATQLDVLERLGIRSPDARTLGWAFVLVLLTWLGLIAWYLGRSMRQRRPDAIARAYALLCRKLSRTGLVRAPHQGSLAYAEALRAGHPSLAEDAHALLAQYARLRYGVPEPATRARDIEEFAGAVRRLRVKSP